MELVDDDSSLNFDDLAGEAAVLNVYRQVFAVLARESNAMIVDPGLIDVDEAILAVFAQAGPEGMTMEQVVRACTEWADAKVRRRFEVLRSYQAITPVRPRPHELFYQAAFAPYVMLLFLRRMADRGGQAELHQLLTMEHFNVSNPQATAGDGRSTARRLTTVFRLLAAQLANLAAGAAVETLRDSAQMLWGNKTLLDEAEKVHNEVLTNWPELLRDCQALRLAIAAYSDAVDAASVRLYQQAGTTRALGFLPEEAWRTFSRSRAVDELATTLDSFLFDAAAPWFTTETIMEAVETGRPDVTVRIPPPRSQADADVDGGPLPHDDSVRLKEVAELLLGSRDSAMVEELLDEAGDWAGARRLLADMTAIHNHDALAFGLRWEDGLRIDPGSNVAWVSRGWLHRTRPGQEVSP